MKGLDILMPMKLQLEYQQFEDLIVTAFEGGINYWAEVKCDKSTMIKYPNEDKTPISFGEKVAYNLWYNEDFVLKVYDVERGEYLGKVKNYLIQPRIEKLIKDGYGENIIALIEENYDAETADVIFQYLVMQDIVFS